jgi:hypothetical protein
MRDFASITTRQDGVMMWGNCPDEDKFYILNLTWEELLALIREKGEVMTAQQVAKQSQRGIRDIMEG